jgi:serine/threonine-protein kinase PpkA
MGKGFEDPKWKLGNRLGEGGQSHVYLATEKGKENSGFYALKKLKNMENNNLITLVDEGVGTANYMAPECESGSVGYITARADLYSAAKVMWSAITGERAFAREKPVFERSSMESEFNDKPATWHLFHIFEKTIRNDPSNRWESAKKALSETKDVRRIISNAYQPLEEIFDRCPICGVGELKSFRGGHQVFGNPNPSGIHAMRCSYCGVCLAIDYDLTNKNLELRQNLD